MVYLYDKDGNMTEYTSSSAPYIIEYWAAAYANKEGKFIPKYDPFKRQYKYHTVGFYVACYDWDYLEKWSNINEYVKSYRDGWVVNLNTNGLFDPYLVTELSYWHRKIIKTDDKHDYHLYTIDPAKNNQEIEL